MVELDNSHAEIAQLLAETLADSLWWERFAVSPDDERRWERTLAKRACHLFAHTNPAVARSFSESVVLPVHRAVAILREIAGAAALRSRPWYLPEARPLLPTRASIELFIRLDDVDDWAAEQGHPLRLVGDDRVPDELWPSDEAQTDAGVGDLVDAWLTIGEVFEEFLDADGALRAVRETHPRLADLRDGVCQLLYGARGWVVWSRARVLTNGQALAVSGLLMAEGMFAATWEKKPGRPLFPSTTGLQELLNNTGAIDWLAEQGADTPEWLC